MLNAVRRVVAAVCRHTQQGMCAHHWDPVRAPAGTGRDVTWACCACGKPSPVLPPPDGIRVCRNPQTWVLDMPVDEEYLAGLVAQWRAAGAVPAAAWR